MFFDMFGARSQPDGQFSCKVNFDLQAPNGRG